MQQVFHYLSEFEEHALLRKGGVRRFRRNEVIIEDGGFPNSLFVIKSGRVLVQQKTSDSFLPIRKLGPGGVFGEMSFLEGIAATATVVADSDSVEIFVIEQVFLERLLENNMEFFGRFYKSLAWILSQRLREPYSIANQNV
jgi:CRP-like cAMP-binding protein